jgi:hypothetical protein
VSHLCLRDNHKTCVSHSLFFTYNHTFPLMIQDSTRFWNQTASKDPFNNFITTANPSEKVHFLLSNSYPSKVQSKVYFLLQPLKFPSLAALLASKLSETILLNSVIKLLEIRNCFPNGFKIFNLKVLKFHITYVSIVITNGI